MAIAGGERFRCEFRSKINRRFTPFMLPSYPAQTGIEHLAYLFGDLQMLPTDK